MRRRFRAERALRLQAVRVEAGWRIECIVRLLVDVLPHAASISASGGIGLSRTHFSAPSARHATQVPLSFRAAEVKSISCSQDSTSHSGARRGWPAMIFGERMGSGRRQNAAFRDSSLVWIESHRGGRLREDWRNQEHRGIERAPAVFGASHGSGHLDPFLV